MVLITIPGLCVEDGVEDYKGLVSEVRVEGPEKGLPSMSEVQGRLGHAETSRQQKEHKQSGGSRWGGEVVVFLEDKARENLEGGRPERRGEVIPRTVTPESETSLRRE